MMRPTKQLVKPVLPCPQGEGIETAAAMLRPTKQLVRRRRGWCFGARRKPVHPHHGGQVETAVLRPTNQLVRRRRGWCV